MCDDDDASVDCELCFIDPVIHGKRAECPDMVSRAAFLLLVRVQIPVGSPVSLSSRFCRGSSQSFVANAGTALHRPSSSKCR